MATDPPDPLPRALVVDDDARLAGVRADLLTALGCEVRTATSAHEAAQLLESGAPIELLVTDINLTGDAEDRSGLTIAQLARAKRPDAVIVAYSSYFDESQLSPSDHPEVSRWFVKGQLSVTDMATAMDEVVALAKVVRVDRQ